MSEQREMTLREWCARLPDHHLVNRQLAELEAYRDSMGERTDAWSTEYNEMKERIAELEAQRTELVEIQEILDDALKEQDRKYTALVEAVEKYTDGCGCECEGDIVGLRRLLKEQEVSDE